MKKEERIYLVLDFDCEILLFCQKKDSYIDLVYLKDIVGIKWMI